MRLACGKMKKKLKRGLQILIVSVIFLFLLWQLFSSWGELSTYELGLDYGLLVFSYVFLLASFLITVYVWQFLLRILGEKLSYREALKIFALSNLARYTPGKIWHVFGKIYLASKEGISKVKTLASISLEFFLTVVAACLVFLLSFAFWFPQFSNKIYLILVAVTFFGLFISYPTVFGVFLNFFLKKFKREEVEINFKYKSILFVLFLFMLHWIFQGIGVFILARAVYSIDVSFLLSFIGAYSVAWVLGFLSFLTPGGLGVREGILVFLLNFFIPLPVAIVISIFARIWSLLFEVFMAAVSWIFVRPKPNPKPKSRAKSNHDVEIHKS